MFGYVGSMTARRFLLFVALGAKKDYGLVSSKTKWKDQCNGLETKQLT